MTVALPKPNEWRELLRYFKPHEIAKLDKLLLATPNNIYRHPYTFHGNNLAFHECTDPTVLLAGPSETGKTTVALALLHQIAIENPGLRAAIVRKVKDTMAASVIQTWEDKILPVDGVCYWQGKRIAVTPFGGRRPAWYDYSNDSKIFVAGLDNAKKVLSAEFDIIFVNQAEELGDEDLEYLETRVTGRAGNIKTRPPQLILDCNPGGAKHPLKLRASRGRLTMFRSQHEDNPTLFDQQTGEITEQGTRTLLRLDNLTGVRYQRLRLGEWAGAEGLYFDTFDSAVHGLNDFALQPGWEVWASMDYGFNHWNMIYLHAKNNDGVIITFHEIGHRKHYPHEIAPDVHQVLSEYGLQFRDLSMFLVGGDAFNKTGAAVNSVAEQYAEHDIILQRAESGPGSRVAKAHTLLRLLGNPERNQPPSWYYVKATCPKLAECIPTLVPDERNDEDVRKVDCNEAGEGGDDPFDSTMIGLYRPFLTFMA